MTLYEKLGTKTIALIDSDPWIRDSLSLLFQCAVCRLAAFDNAAEGIRAVETRHFDIIICDYALPGMDGIAFLRHAGRCQPAAIRILTVGYPVGDLAEAMAREGIRDCLQKPFTFDALEKVLEGSVDEIPVAAGEPVRGTAE